MSNKKISLFNKKISCLKKNNYIPSTIIDAGAFRGLWTKEMLKIYPDSKYYLFEGNSHDELNILNDKNNINIYDNTILFDSNTEVDWYKENFTGDSIFKEKSILYRNTKPIKKSAVTLDSICKNDNILLHDKNIFFKIDCQGAEIAILKGSTGILKNTDFILLEIPLFYNYNNDVLNFTEHIKFLESINFVVFDIIDKHLLNSTINKEKKYSFQVDMLFINKNCEYYSKFNNSPIIYNVLLNEGNNNHVVNYIKEKKNKNINYKVIDIGGSAEYTSWSHSVIDYIVDINKSDNISENSHIKYFHFDVNFETQWQVLFDYVKINGKFDFCIASHIIEDISLPQVLLNNLKYIAKEGYISFPSKYVELTKICDNKFLGYIHHRWIFTLKNNKLLGFPKINYIDTCRELTDLGPSSVEYKNLSFFWKNDLEYSIINDNYLGPTQESVKKYYNELLIDDTNFLKDLISNKNLKIWDINYLKHINCIELAGNIFQFNLNLENLYTDLEFLETKLQLIPFDINLDLDDITKGKKNLLFIFIKKDTMINFLEEFNEILTDNHIQCRSASI